MKASVYILRDSGNGRLYIGSTEDLERRLRQHRCGHTKTTKRMVDPQLVFSQAVESVEMARRLEKRLKRLKRRDYLEKIIKDGIIKKLD